MPAAVRARDQPVAARAARRVGAGDRTVAGAARRGRAGDVRVGAAVPRARARRRRRPCRHRPGDRRRVVPTARRPPAGVGDRRGPHADLGCRRHRAWARRGRERARSAPVPWSAAPPQHHRHDPVVTRSADPGCGVAARQTRGLRRALQHGERACRRRARRPDHRPVHGRARPRVAGVGRHPRRRGALPAVRHGPPVRRRPLARERRAARGVRPVRGSRRRFAAERAVGRHELVAAGARERPRRRVRRHRRGAAMVRAARRVAPAGLRAVRRTVGDRPPGSRRRRCRARTERPRALARHRDAVGSDRCRLARHRRVHDRAVPTSPCSWPRRRSPGCPRSARRP